jgi:cysteine synthase
MKLNLEKLLKNVPITKIDHIKNNEVYTILEKFNICGSVKIKAVYFILKKALES